MNNRINLIAILSIAVFTLSAQGISPEHQAYINQYKDVAIREMERTGIPASIKLAQALLESGAGTSLLATEANNHFGIKEGGEWYGEVYYKEDDDRNIRGEIIPSPFRKYVSVDQSFIDHSDFLTDPKKLRYDFLFRLDPTDYKAWARGLKKAAYATSRKYPSRLISLIERYRLYQYDQPVATIPVVKAENPIVIIGKTQLAQIQVEDNHTVQKGETLWSISKKYNRNVNDLKRRNRLATNTISVNQIIVLQ